MADGLPLFGFRVNAADLIPANLLRLDESEQQELWTTFMADLDDFLGFFSSTQSQFTVTIMADAAILVYTNAPSGGAAEWGGSTRWRTIVDLSNCTEARLVTRSEGTGAAGAQLALQASVDGTTFDYLDGVSGPFVPLDAVGTFASSWGPIATAYRVDTHIRPVHVAGDGTADPGIGLTVAHFR